MRTAGCADGYADGYADGWPHGLEPGARLVHALRMHPGDLIGAYRIDAVGAADFAVTHLATQRPARLRWVEPASDITEFVQVARRVCGLKAPTLHGLIDVGIVGERCYLVDPPAPGEALNDHVRRLGPFAGDALLSFAESLFSALIELHNRDLHDGALHPGRVRVADGRACITEPGVGRLLPRLAPPTEFSDPAASGVDADLFAAAALVCFAAHGRALPPAVAPDGVGMALPIITQLRGCLGIEGARPTADAVRRTLEAVRAGTLAPDAPHEPAVDAPAASSDWVTTSSVDPPAPQHFDAGQVPDELPTARAPNGLNSAAVSVPLSAPPSVPRPAQLLAQSSTPRSARPGAQHGRSNSAAPRLASRPASPPRAPAPPTRPTKAIAIAAAVLVVGVVGVLVWRQLAPAPTPTADLPAPSAPIGPAPSASSTASLAAAASTASAVRHKYAHVTLVAQPGPARFVQVESGTVVCESAMACQVPIDIETRVEMDGHAPRVLSGDDLYDRRGNRWTIRLRTLP